MAAVRKAELGPPDIAGVREDQFVERTVAAVNGVIQVVGNGSVEFLYRKAEDVAADAANEAVMATSAGDIYSVLGTGHAGRVDNIVADPADDGQDATGHVGKQRVGSGEYVPISDGQAELAGHRQARSVQCPKRR